MAGYWPRSCQDLFLHVYGTRRSGGPQTRTEKKRTNILPSLTEHASIVKKKNLHSRKKESRG